MNVRIDHIALYVNDLEGAKNFFETYFQAVSNEGYHNETTDFRSYFLTFSDGSRLGLMTKPDLTDSGSFRLRPHCVFRWKQGSGGGTDRTAKCRWLPHPVRSQSHRGWIL